MLPQTKSAFLQIMKPLVVSSDSVLLSSIDALLKSEGINAILLDQQMSLIHAGIDAIPQRLMVENGDWTRACDLLKAADLGHFVFEPG